MAGTALLGQEPKWGEILYEFFDATASPLTLKVERLLLEILRHEGELQLDESSPMTHRMSPEKMLKSLALKALAKWTGATYLPTMLRLEATAKPASFACAVRGVIETVTTTKGLGRHSEGVPEIHCESTSVGVESESSADLSEEVIEYIPRKKIRIKGLVLQHAFGMTFMPRGDKQGEWEVV
jgi:hypothetical protein